MRFDRIDYLSPVPASERDDARDLAAAASLKDEPVSRDKPVVGERKPPEPVVSQRIDTRLIKDDVRAKAIEYGRKMLLQQGEVFVIFGPVG